MIAGLLVGGAAGCSSDEKASSDGGTEETTAGGNGGEDSGNADVAAYCKAVDEYVAKVKDDPSAAAADATELSEKAQALATAGLSADEAQEVADCTKKSTDALTGG